MSDETQNVESSNLIPEIPQVVDRLKALMRQVSPLMELIAILERIGPVERALKETETRLEKKRAEESELDACLESVRNDASEVSQKSDDLLKAARQEVAELREKGNEFINDANGQAKTIIQNAETRAKAIVASAEDAHTGIANKTNALNTEAATLRGKIAEMRIDLANLQSERSEAQAFIDKVNAIRESN